MILESITEVLLFITKYYFIFVHNFIIISIDGI